MHVEYSSRYLASFTVAVLSILFAIVGVIMYIKDERPLYLYSGIGILVIAFTLHLIVKRVLTKEHMEFMKSLEKERRQ